MAKSPCLLPISDASIKMGSSKPTYLTLFNVSCPCHRLFNKPSSSKPQFPLYRTVYTENRSISPPTKLPSAILNSESGPISALNERIRRDLGKREAVRPVMDAEEADKYTRMVKDQQRRGLGKLKENAGSGEKGDDGDKFSYKVDPYTLKPGDYVVHKKVGIGRFVGIKFDVSKGNMDSIEDVYIEYADGMAKPPVQQASRMLYRYSLPNETKKPRTLSKLSDRSAWERRKSKGKVAV